MCYTCDIAKLSSGVSFQGRVPTPPSCCSDLMGPSPVEGTPKPSVRPREEGLGMGNVFLQTFVFDQIHDHRITSFIEMHFIG